MKPQGGNGAGGAIADHARPERPYPVEPPATRAAVIGAYLAPKADRGRTRSDRTVDNRLEEAIGLTEAIGVNVVHREALSLNAIRPATFLGSGHVATLKRRVADDKIALVIVDTTLSPTQQRNLERDLNAKVLDRTGLILEIFGERAQTREGRLQVDFAHLSYQKSRLVRSWTHLERQRGSLGFIGGPGETQIESDRRQLQERISRIEKELASVRRTRGLHRNQRQRNRIPVVALVGYTNAGKSTLFNRLTGAGVVAKDQLFATLDPTARQVALPGGPSIILSDTVGFISDLPTTLVAAFRATLEEVIEADVILHIRDVSQPDSDIQAQDVEDVLRQLGIDPETDDRIVTVWNKADLISAEDCPLPMNGGTAAANGNGSQRPLLVSALTGEGIDTLTSAIEAFLSEADTKAQIVLAPHEGAAMNWLYERGQVVTRDDLGDGRVSLSVVLAIERLDQFKKQFCSAKHDIQVSAEA